MKEELDEILGPRGEEREGAEVGEEEEETFIHRGVRSQVAKQGEGGGTDHLDNCPGKDVTSRFFYGILFVCTIIQVSTCLRGKKVLNNFELCHKNVRIEMEKHSLFIFIPCHNFCNFFPYMNDY